MTVLSSLRSSFVSWLLLFLLFVPSISFAAISFDNEASGGNSSSGTLTFGLTVASGATNVEVLCFQNEGGTPLNSIIGVTYAGASLSLLQGDYSSLNTQFLTIYGLSGSPTAGTNNVVVTFTAGQSLTCYAFSYLGGASFDLGAMVDSSGSTGSFSPQYTTAAAGEWVSFIGDTNNGNTVTAGSGSYLRYQNGGNAVYLGDSNSGFVSAGINTLNFTATSQQWQIEMVGIEPATGGGGGSSSSTEATSTVDQTERNLWEGWWTFAATAAFIIWLFE